MRRFFFLVLNLFSLTFSYTPFFFFCACFSGCLLQGYSSIYISIPFFKKSFVLFFFFRVTPSVFSWNTTLIRDYISLSLFFFFCVCASSFYTRDSVTTIPLFRLLKLLLLYQVLVTVSWDDDPPCFSFSPFLQFFKKQKTKNKRVASFCSHCCQKNKNTQKPIFF